MTMPNGTIPREMEARMENQELERHVDRLVERHPRLAGAAGDVLEAYRAMEGCFQGGGKLLVAGNGGSAADSEHIVGELMKSFRLRRPLDPAYGRKLLEADPERGPYLAGKLEGALPAIPLTGLEALSTAYANDVDGALTYAQQLYGYGRPGDVFLGITTSGNSRNVLDAAVVARASGLKVVALTGRDGGRISRLADVTVRVPEDETYLVQELHLPIYHCWCMMLEERFFGKD